MATGSVRYAKAGDLRIAYSADGSGPTDLVFVSGWVTPPEALRKDLRPARFIEQLAAFSRVIRFDRRGTGLSDRAIGASSVDQRVEDLRAVLDDAKSERAVLLGHADGVLASIFFAALHPDRVVALVLLGAPPKRVWAPAAARLLGLANGSIDPAALGARLEIPSLVLYRAGERPAVDDARGFAGALRQARVVELPGSDPAPWADPDRLLLELEELVRGTAAAASREIATVLFTDLVGSTDLLRQVGDRAWRERATEHDLAVRRELARYEAEEMKNTGDGFLAIFASPSRAVRCAVGIREALAAQDLEVRAGIHTGEIERGGREVRGIAVHLAARIMASASPGQILLSSTTRDLISGSGIELVDEGERSFKGIPEAKRVYSLGPSAITG